MKPRPLMTDDIHVRRDQKKDTCMNNIIRNSLSSIILLVLTACNLGGTANPSVFEDSVLRMTVRSENNVTTFSQAGDIINYRYRITNTGDHAWPGPSS